MALLPHRITVEESLEQEDTLTMVLPERIVLEEILELTEMGYLTRIKGKVDTLAKENSELIPFCEKLLQFYGQFDYDAMEQFLKEQLFRSKEEKK